MHATHYMPQLFCRHIWNKSGLALFAGLVVLTTVAEAEESHAETQRDKLAAEEDQQAQRNASFPTAQRSALETELKKAQERAQLAEKHSDLSEPNAGPKAEPLASTQPSDSSVQSSETTARPGPASNSVPAAIESWNEENRGIGFAEATALIAVEANPAPQHDPLTSDQQPVKLVRINQSRSPVPLPTPSAAASMQSTPPEAQTDGRIWISREVQSLKELILEYHRLTMISRRQNSSPQMGTPDSSQIPIPALASEINQPDAQANVSPESSARGHDSARMIPPKILNIRHRSVVPSRLVDVKARLIALWHQSLARSQRASSRPVLSNSNKDANKKDDAKLTID
jgi:hypothetical protein